MILGTVKALKFVLASRRLQKDGFVLMDKASAQIVNFVLLEDLNGLKGEFFRVANTTAPIAKMEVEINK